MISAHFEVEGHQGVYVTVVVGYRVVDKWSSRGRGRRS